MTTVLSDTTALIVLAAQQRLDLFAGCFVRVLLPDAVYREWLAGDPGDFTCPTASTRRLS